MQGFSPVFCFSLAFIIPDMYLLFSIYRTFTLAEEGLLRTFLRQTNFSPDTIDDRLYFLFYMHVTFLSAVFQNPRIKVIIEKILFYSDIGWWQQWSF
jgi:hypothetical protein